MNDETKLSDYPKLHCPFVRKKYPISKEHFKKYGKKLGLRKPNVYLATNEIDPHYAWVFEDLDTFATEKLDGTSCKVHLTDGKIDIFQNRANVIDHTQIYTGKTFLLEGLIHGANLGYLQKNGEQAGEILGPKLQSNPYKLPYHVFYPFEKAISSLRYTSFQKYDKTYENLSSWFHNNLHSRFYQKWHKVGLAESPMAEGVVFYNLKRGEENKSWRAKLRRNMFGWYYEDHGIEIDYSNPLE